MSQQENDGFKQTTASGGETNIPFDFKIGDRAELKLVRTRAGTSETLVLNTDYTIADNQLNIDLGGVCVLIGSANPAIAGDVYTALLNTPYSRGTLNLSADFNQAGDFLADVLNTQLDYQVRMHNRTARDVGKSLKFAETIDISNAVISQAPIDGALLGFNGVSGEVVPRTLASLSLTGLDTTFASLAAGDSLVYNGSSWTNRKLLGPTGTSIASAGTTDIGAANSDYIDITGTTTITSFGSTTTRNHVWLNFTGVLTLTHNAVSLILPGNANITTAVGDVGEFIRWTGSNWKCVSYQRKDGTILSDGAVSTAAKIADGIITYAKTASSSIASFADVLAGTASKFIPASVGQQMLGHVLLSTQTASNSASLNFTSVITSSYNTYVFVLEDIVPATDGANLLIRTSTNNGSSYDAGATDYRRAGRYNQDGSASTFSLNNAGASSVEIMGGIGNASGESGSGSVTFYNPLGTAAFRMFKFDCVYMTSTPNLQDYNGVGVRATNADIDAVQFLMSAGNITSGVIRCYGVRK